MILGGPGCGKTTRLLSIVQDELASGVRPDEIAFVAFTKAAADEARTRAAERFGLNPKEDLPWFRTIHSLAYHTLHMARDEVMGSRDWKTFSDLVREPMKGTYEMDGPVITEQTKNIGDSMLRIVDYASTTCQSLAEAWRELDEPIDWFRLKRFADALERFKRDAGKVDFTDMLHMYVAHNEPLNVRVAIIDEAQDLTRAQWKVVEHAFARCERVYVGGDDDQAIYRWAGADVDYFLGLQGIHEVLPRSHRLPTAVFALAQSVVQRISARFPKQYQADDRPGAVEFCRSTDDLDLHSGTWLLLARNGYLLGDFERMCESAGVSYRTRNGDSVSPEHVAAIRVWEGLRSGKLQSASAEEFRALAKFLGLPRPTLRETQPYTVGDFPTWPWGTVWHVAFTEIAARTREYYISCLRRGEKLTRAPRVRIETIHGVKGAEADHILLSRDISGRTAESLQRAPDHEHRVFYVGVTRARHSLHILDPQTPQSYDL